MKIVAMLFFAMWLMICHQSLAQTIPQLALGERLLDHLVSGEVTTTLVLKKRTTDGSLNVCGLTTNRTFTSYGEYIRFVGENGCRLKSFLSTNAVDIHFFIWTITSKDNVGFGYGGSLGFNQQITPSSFHFLPSKAVEIPLRGVVSAKYRTGSDSEFITLPVKSTGVVLENFFSTNSGRLRIVLELENSEVVTYTQSGLPITPPRVSLYKSFYDDWWYDEINGEIIYRDPQASILVFVDSTPGADTLVESSEDLVSWKKVGEIRWDYFPYFSTELRPGFVDRLFIRAMSY